MEVSEWIPFVWVLKCHSDNHYFEEIMLAN